MKDVRRWLSAGALVMTACVAAQAAPPTAVVAGANDSGAVHGAVNGDFAVYVAGDNGYGQVVGVTPGTNGFQTVALPGFARSMAFGERHVIVALDDGTVASWGGQGDWLGRTASGAVDQVPTRVQTALLTGGKQVAAAASTSYVLTEGGSVYAFGANNAGQLGNGTPNTPASSLQAVKLNLAQVAAISAQNANAGALDASGNLYLWGSNDSGQIGQGTSGGNTGTPTLVAMPAKVKAFAIGAFHVLAVTADGRVYAWGRNAEGQLGQGNTQAKLVPTLVPGIANAVSVAAGRLHSVVLLADGSVRTFGSNSDGQLGINAIGGQQSSPQTPSGLPAGGAVSIAAGYLHTVVGVGGGSSSSFAAYTAGDNAYGQLRRASPPTDAGSFGVGYLAGVSPYQRRTGLDAKGTSGVLWRNATTGQNVHWNTAAAPSSANARNLDTVAAGWQVVGTGDVNFDSVSDVFWYNAGSGELAYWAYWPLGGQPTVIRYGTIGGMAPATGWRPVSIGDFDGDGVSDVLWRNAGTGELAVWYLKANGMVGVAAMLGAVSAAWTVVDSGDFNGDGIADVLFRNTTTGEVAIWYMSQLPANYTAVVLAAPALAWQVQGVVDVDGDGRSDIVWRNASTGENAVWYLNGTVVAARYLPTVPAAAWKIESTWFGSGASLLWRNTSTGEVAYWQLPAGKPASTIPVTSSGSLGVIPLQWSIAKQ